MMYRVLLEGQDLHHKPIVDEIGLNQRVEVAGLKLLGI